MYNYFISSNKYVQSAFCTPGPARKLRCTESQPCISEVTACDSKASWMWPHSSGLWVHISLVRVWDFAFCQARTQKDILMGKAKVVSLPLEACAGEWRGIYAEHTVRSKGCCQKLGIFNRRYRGSLCSLGSNYPQTLAAHELFILSKCQFLIIAALQDYLED